MANSTRLQRKDILIRGLQMLIFGFFINLGLTIIGFLAFVQFFLFLINREKNLFIANLASGLRDWFGQAIQFILVASDYKPFFLGQKYSHATLYFDEPISFNSLLGRLN